MDEIPAGANCNDHGRQGTSSVTLMGTTFYHCDECAEQWKAMRARHAREMRVAGRRSFAAYGRQLQNYQR